MIFKSEEMLKSTNNKTKNKKNKKTNKKTNLNNRLKNTQSKTVIIFLNLCRFCFYFLSGMLLLRQKMTITANIGRLHKY